MRQEIAEAPNEMPIVYVLIVLGLLSYLATFSVIGLQKESLLVFDVTIVVGSICGLCSLPLGLKLSSINISQIAFKKSGVSSVLP